MNVFRTVETKAREAVEMLDVIKAIEKPLPTNVSGIHIDFDICQDCTESHDIKKDSDLYREILKLVIKHYRLDVIATKAELKELMEPK